MQGGDTDTNAAIVCGLIGAAYGLSEIDQKYIKAILSFEPPSHRGRDKEFPTFVVPKCNLIPMVDRVI